MKDRTNARKTSGHAMTNVDREIRNLPSFVGYMIYAFFKGVFLQFRGLFIRGRLST